MLRTTIRLALGEYSIELRALDRVSGKSLVQSRKFAIVP